MCGIAGFSLASDSSLDPSQLSRLLLAGIAERGDDASGYAYSSAGGISTVKVRGGASRLLEALKLPAGSREALLHVRDHTKGAPDVEVNNHPIRSGAVVGVHNGRLANDDELFLRHSLERAPESTVDSEAIFALIDAYPGRAASAFEEIEGAMAVAWLDERRPSKLGLARGLGRPLAIGYCAEGVLFASTVEALEIAALPLDLELDIAPADEGVIYLLEGGRVIAEEHFLPQLGDVVAPVSDEPPSPEERLRCFSLLSLAVRPASA